MLYFGEWHSDKLCSLYTKTLLLGQKIFDWHEALSFSVE